MRDVTLHFTLSFNGETGNKHDKLLQQQCIFLFTWTRTWVPSLRHMLSFSFTTLHHSTAVAGIQVKIPGGRSSERLRFHYVCLPLTTKFYCKKYPNFPHTFPPTTFHHTDSTETTDLTLPLDKAIISKSRSENPFEILEFDKNLKTKICAMLKKIQTCFLAEFNKRTCVLYVWNFL